MQNSDSVGQLAAFQDPDPMFCLRKIAAEGFKFTAPILLIVLVFSQSPVGTHPRDAFFVAVIDD
ncbi:MAG TPA: hypothetical protein DCE47_07595 [Planctomycetaceae bacterium]|nr:hypothetical protein [Planctomycetaceae bacterium]HCD00607.1 hypothetical protein [Planctomycetaceae bacterium]|tara:strand:- start:1462 stop:1653 length:192 start_codon:yes stop_codon:yes gene_type:complete